MQITTKGIAISRVCASLMSDITESSGSRREYASGVARVQNGRSRKKVFGKKKGQALINDASGYNIPSLARMKACPMTLNTCHP